MSMTVPDLREAILRSTAWLEWAIKAPIPDTPDFARNRREYVLNIGAAIESYLTGDRSVTSFKNEMKREIVERFPDAFYRGYAEEGAEETEAEDERWLTDRMNQELDFVDGLFESLRDLRGEVDAVDEAHRHSEGYGASLDGVYTEGRLRGAKARTLVFEGDDGEENCDTCRGLKGKRHKIRWILDNDAIPRPGNGFFICQGYQCRHAWFDPKTGERFTF